MKTKTGKIQRSNQEDDEERAEGKKWYEELPEEPKNVGEYSEQILIELKEEARKCYEADVNNYNSKKQSSNFQWMKAMMSKGTVSDKIAAHTLLIQENPLCNIETLRGLVNMVKVGKKRECVAVIGTLVELLLSDILIPYRKLKAFHQRPLLAVYQMSSGSAGTRKKLLTWWYFEDQLKETYTSFVMALNTVAHDTVESNKDKAVTAMYKLLAGNAEQEKNLLKYVVNKLGDPSQKIASKVIYCLTQLLHKHPNMQKVVLDEIEKLIFRPNVAKRAQYYSLCFLSQYHLNHETSEVAKKLIEVYFAFFKACVKTGDVDTRMMSALLTGLNRAYPYAKVDISKISEHIDTMYRLVHLAQFNTSLQALILLYQVCDFESGDTSRFYNALYRKLLDPNLLTTTHKAMLLSLVYKALLKDKEVDRIKVFVKRLLQVSLFVQADFTCGILYLVSQLLSKKEGLLAFLLKKPDTDDDDGGDERYFDIKDETEIKEEPCDSEYERVEVNGTTTTNLECDDDVKPPANSAGWYHRENLQSTPSKVQTTYNPLARNPLHGGGQFCCYTELLTLQEHFHPTVSLFAKNVVRGENVTYGGDPLNDFTLIRFLDRFVFKNPKRIEEKSGKDPTFSKRRLCRPRGVKSMSVRSAEYANEDSKNIPVDELFLHSFLQSRNNKTQDKDDESDMESVQSEEFEEMLDQMSGFKNRYEDDIDYLDEIGDTLKREQKKGSKEKSNDVSDEEVNESDISQDEFGSDIDEEIDFSEEGSDEEIIQKPAKKKRRNDTASLFASAEEFATLLEEEGSSKLKPGGSNTFSNVDNAGTKQLAWEEKRNRWIKGFDRNFNKGKKKPLGKNDRGEFKKRKSKSSFSNVNKKTKK